MFRVRELNRWQAFSGHLFFSALLGIGTFSLFRFVWYPQALWDLSGAGRLLLIVLGVDVTLGPLLTLAVFDPRKRLLMMDLAIIFALQFGALAYGLKVMADSRPVFLVAAVDRFVVVSANEVERSELPKITDPSLRKMSWTGPKLVGCRELSAQEKSDLLFEVLASGRDVQDYPRFYVPFAKVRDDILSRALPIDDPRIANHPERARLIEAIRATGLTETAVRILLLSGRDGFGSAIIDAKTGEPLATVAVELP